MNNFRTIKFDELYVIGQNSAKDNHAYIICSGKNGKHKHKKDFVSVRI